MPIKHSYGDIGTAVIYSLDAVTGQPVRPISTGGALAVISAPPTSGGLLTAKVIAAASTNTAFLKASAGQVFGVELANNAAYAVFFKLYNKASAPNLAVDVPVMVIQINAGGRCEINRPAGIEFTAGIAIAAVKLLADTDTTALVAGDIVGSVQYK